MNTISLISRISKLVKCEHTVKSVTKSVKIVKTVITVKVLKQFNWSDLLKRFNVWCLVLTALSTTSPQPPP